MGHDKVHFDLDKEHYKFEGSIKTMTIVFMALGLLGAIWAFFDNGGWNHHARFWSNFLLNSYYFRSISCSLSILWIGISPMKPQSLKS